MGSCESSSPKGTDFGKVTNEEVQHAVELICDRARKVLKYRTANEVFREMLHSALQSAQPKKRTNDVCPLMSDNCRVAIRF